MLAIRLEGRPLALKLPVRPLCVLSEEQLDSLHRASVQILERVGVEIYCDGALELLAQAGASVNRLGCRVRFPSEMVEAAISTAPARFSLRGRGPGAPVEVGGNAMVLAPVGGPSMIADLEGGPRPGRFADQVNFIKLSHSSRLLDLTYRCVEAQDLPAATRHLDFLEAAIRYSHKPFGAMSLDAGSAVDTLLVAALVFDGGDQLRQGPVVLAGVNVDSPLRLSRETADTIIAFARAGQPVKITPFVLTGVMSPVTLAGALAQENAEALAGIVLAQVARSGAPVLYGTFASHADMRTASPMFGGPEGLLMEVAAGQLARRYGIPHRGMGLVTTAPTCGIQAAMEKMNCLWALAQSNVQLLMHAAGWLEGGLTASYEQFVLDLEMLESMERFQAGFQVNEGTLALDTIAAVGPGGSFLMADHTLANHRMRGFPSPLLENRPYDAWQADGRPSLLQGARTMWRQWLQEYEAPPADQGLLDSVHEYVERRKRGEQPALAASQRGDVTTLASSLGSITRN